MNLGWMWAALLVLGNRFEQVVETDVDTIELNCYYDQAGKLAFRQIVFWESRYLPARPEGYRGQWHQYPDVVVAWRIVQRWPVPTRHAGRWRMTWLDDQHGSGTIRRVTASSVVRTWTQHDPEVINRRIMCPSRRRGLR